MRRLNLDFSIQDIIELFAHYTCHIKYAISKKSPSFPIVFHIQTINTCNGSCTMCPYSKEKPGKIEEMPNQLFEKIIKEIAYHQSRYTYVHLYLQNEPFLDKDVFRKLKYIKDVSNGRITTGITTNGVLLTPDKIPELTSSDLDELVVSLDAFTEKTYSKIRVGLNFNTVINNIEAIINSGYKKDVYVEFTKQKENASELNDFIKYWKGKRLPILLFFINNRGGGVDNFDKYNKNIGKDFLISRLKKGFAQKVVRCCPLTLSTFNIRSNGDVVICCNDYGNQMILGNINTSTIKEIWNSETYNKIREKFRNNKHKKIPACKLCSIWSKNC